MGMARKYTPEQKAAKAAALRKWRAENPDKAREQAARSNANRVVDPVANRARVKKWQQANREAVNAKNREWRAKNPEKAREYELAKKAKDPERYRAYYRKRAREKAGMVDATGETLSGPCQLGCSHDGQLVMDHDHTNGLRRGWLCDACNKALGGFCDDPEVLEAAARYIRLWRENHRKALTVEPA